MTSSTRLIAVVAAFSLPTSAAGAVELCHVANAGFLIKGSDAAVLVDGLMEEDQYQGRFALPSPSHIKAMLDKTDNYKNLSLVVSTHRHGDHFDPLATIKHLRATDGVTYAYSVDAVASLDANGLTDREHDRVIVVPDSTQTEFSVGNIEVQTFDIDHGPNMPQNIGYRITVDGVSVFHTGDINASRQQLESAGVNALPVDALIMPFWFGHQDPVQIATINQSWNAKMVIPTHFNPKPAPWMAQFGGLVGIKESVTKSFDKAEIITEEGKCVTIE